MGKRAEVLAGRVEAGAELLAQFAEGLTDAEWNARVRDGRTVGVIDKATAIGLLRSNSKEAAAAVREFTDPELDTAAGFSLSFGAPMTAQFVVEDHAMRHAWHHLARIKQALGR